MTRERLKAVANAEVVAYGHLGDGNVHLNVSVPKLQYNIQSLLEPFVYQFCAERQGSISAEHGQAFIDIWQQWTSFCINEGIKLSLCRPWPNEEQLYWVDLPNLQQQQQTTEVTFLQKFMLLV